MSALIYLLRTHAAKTVLLNLSEITYKTEAKIFVGMRDKVDDISNSYSRASRKRGK